MALICQKSAKQQLVYRYLCINEHERLTYNSSGQRPSDYNHVSLREKHEYLPWCIQYFIFKST
jgi:hypothetical protein